MPPESNILPAGWNQEQFLQSLAALKAIEHKSRGGDNMFRIIYMTHITRSRMADHKAHFMLGVNTFVLSFVVTKKKMGILSHTPGLLIPDIMLVVLCITCIILATLVTKPTLPSNKKAKATDLAAINWLFFGDFARYNLEEFNRGLAYLTSNPDALTDAMTRDVYWLGISLAKKYRYLAICYQVFYAGLVVLTAVFLIFAWNAR
jgi:hypothetical protein